MQVVMCCSCACSLARVVVVIYYLSLLWDLCCVFCVVSVILFYIQVMQATGIPWTSLYFVIAYIVVNMVVMK